MELFYNTHVSKITFLYFLQNDRNIGVQENNSSVYSAKDNAYLYICAQVTIALPPICIFKNRLFAGAFYKLFKFRKLFLSSSLIKVIIEVINR